MTAEREPAVCGDVSWCGHEAGHEPLVDHRGRELAHAVAADGVYDIPAQTYHADPTVAGSLSSTGAKLLSGPRSAPAKFAHYREHGRPDKATFDVGRAAHRKVLGAGGAFAVIPDELCGKTGKWDTTAAKHRVAEVRAAGMTPIKPSTHKLLEAMAEALLRDPDARALLEAAGRHEPAVFWTDPETNVVCRTMLDTLPDPNDDGLLIPADYKTAEDASPEACRRAMWDHGFHRQAAWCLDAVDSLHLVDPAAVRFAFISQEKSAPYLVTVWYPDALALQLGDWRNRQARAAYAECTRTGRWPGYTDGPVKLALPAWREREEMEEMG